jgi:hypothetical protein
VSEYEEIVETSGDYRAVIKLDDDVQKPEDYGMVAVIQTDSSGYGSLKGEAFNEHAEQYVDAFNRLCDLYHGNGYRYEVFERYMRIFHGATKVDSYNVGTIREYGYVAFDTAAWREEMGVGEAFEAEDILHDIRAWAEGDAWGVGVEQRVEGTDEDEDMWEETDEGFVWGYLGHDYAEQEARDLLKAKLEEK